MSTTLLQLNHYFGIREQPLHRVLIYAPTLIWVQQGHKLLWWQDRRLSFDKGSWL
ncbi:AraC family transcriptional regulator, partial [Aeromonas salmonicida subsp. salmonicida]|nr:AraC family transcriptional regulator [Aeromonas salmonicida subsp. salmonicida]